MQCVRNVAKNTPTAMGVQLIDFKISRGAVARKTLMCAFILLGLASAIAIPADEGARDSRQVKVERKPKRISNGAGQKPFDVTRHAVPLSEIERSVAKDVIPALVHPKFVEAGQVGKLLDDRDRVLGIFINGEAKAYPIRILSWHELVNDQAGGRPILVSW
jgi:uncharacterized protein DUF3179